MTNGGDNKVFLDTNVLVFANAEESPLHDAALKAIETRYDAEVELWTSRQVLREYLATFSRPQRFMNPRPIATVIERVRFFQSRFQVAEDSPEVTKRLLALMQHVAIGGKQVHDANIVATMLTYGIPSLLTHNTGDFVRFGGYITIVPLTTGTS